MDKGQFIAKMEQALAEVNQVKQQLQRNATEVKSQIHSGISRQLEALRNREVWLLNQVELIQNMKDEVLHAQQARLNKMIGVAQSGLTDSLGNEFTECQDLKPDENPWIVFKVDSAKLRESITSYGRVESSNRPSTSVFVKPGHPARSLPPHFEDYDDADHHVLYKTVEGVTKSTQNTQVTFTLPILSSSSKDWLASSTTPSTSNQQPRFSFPSSSLSNHYWLKPPATETPSVSPMSSSDSWSLPRQDTDASIQMWLKDIKQNPVIEEEDDFEVLSKRDLIGMGRSRNTSMSSSASAPNLRYMDNESWLLPSKDYQTNPIKAFKLPPHLEASNNETWLCRKWKRNAKAGCGEKCEKTTALEIENICDYLNDKIWVKSASDNRKMDVCKANEPCQGPDACLAKTNCFYSMDQDNALEDDHKTWLLNGGKNVKPTTTIQSRLFEQFKLPSVDGKENIWLRGHDTNQRNLEEWKAKPVQLDEKVWIKQGISPPESTTPYSSSVSWEKVMTFHKEFDTNQWVLHESGKSEKSLNDENPWILKSSENIKENDIWILANKDEDADMVQ